LISAFFILFSIQELNTSSIRRFATIKRPNPWIVNILRLGCYQILYMDRVPDSAACNEMVKLCKSHGLAALKGFVNGILRNIVRHKDELKFPQPGLSEIENLALTYSFPIRLVEKWVDDYGIQTAEDILKKPALENRISIRVNTVKISPRELVKRLSEMGIESWPAQYVDDALYINDAGDIENNQLHRDGLFAVQGESSMLVSRLLAPREGEFILDACSSPGGKSTHIASMVGKSGRVLAWDIHPHRVKLVEKNAERLGVSEIVKANIQDAAKPAPELYNSFDRVLVDAPCTGWGIIHKKPDIKFRATLDGIDELTNLQHSILSTCSRYVRPGGMLVYSTCTINADENEHVIERFLCDNTLYEAVDSRERLPGLLRDAYLKDGMIRLLPGRDRVDGFFIACMRRKG
jgi:16S rRNA (cytosine967-C5)-methyltransferase